MSGMGVKHPQDFHIMLGSGVELCVRNHPRSSDGKLVSAILGE